MTPKAHLFDMDGTLISLDTDVSWQYFLQSRGLVPDSAGEEAEKFYQQYNNGTLDVPAFLAFQFQCSIGKPEAEFLRLAREHFEQAIRPCLFEQARRYIAGLKEEGKILAVLTSTCVELARPAANALGIDEVLGTEILCENGLFTGRLAGIYGLGPGKVAIADAWRKTRNLAWEDLAYYGDSINDRFILEKVGEPIAVNPSPSLRSIADAKNWPVVLWSK